MNVGDDRVNLSASNEGRQENKQDGQPVRDLPVLLKVHKEGGTAPAQLLISSFQLKKAHFQSQNTLIFLVSRQQTVVLLS